MINHAEEAGEALRQTLRRVAEGTGIPEESPREWLFSLARSECLHRDEWPVVLVAGDELGAAGPPPTPAVMAWRAVMSLARPEREILALAAWLDMSPAQAARVTGLPEPDLRVLLDQARDLLHRAVAAEVLAGRDAGECASRAAIIGDRSRMLSYALRGLLLTHAQSCPDCAGHLPQDVSAARVYRILPFPRLSERLAADLRAAGEPGTAPGSPAAAGGTSGTVAAAPAAADAATAAAQAGHGGQPGAQAGDVPAGATGALDPAGGGAGRAQPPVSRRVMGGADTRPPARPRARPLNRRRAGRWAWVGAVVVAAVVVGVLVAGVARLGAGSPASRRPAPGNGQVSGYGQVSGAGTVAGQAGVRASVPRVAGHAAMRRQHHPRRRRCHGR